MEPKARHILIGLFTSIMILAAVAFAFFLTQNKGQEKYFYKVLFQENVTGLSRGSAVLYSGINVGEVVRLTLNKKDPRHVDAIISVDKDIVDIREGVRARLQLMGVTGQAVISLKGGNPNSPQLPKITELPPEDDDDTSIAEMISRKGSEIFSSLQGGNVAKIELPVIPSDTSPLSALLEDGQNAMANLTEISLNLKTLFSDKNMKHAGNILAHIDGLTGTVAGEEETIKEVIKGANKTIAEFNKTLASFERLANNTDKMLTSEGKKALSNASQAMISLSDSTKKIQGVITQNQGNLNQGLQGFKELTPAIIEFKRAFGSLQKILQNMEDNPGGYFIDGNAMKEFRP
ncbi:hypothetical protein V757_03420 [Pelistega indica]|uniref:Mce/MlaD domain-containing protein n=1 Tax=Pelistega indica TaxID=1414851 RepID=V8G7S9_9BURK|nr:MlaD family protein [Pelistega indica]ETD72589.1 hypothetical protein V757_03420 [Pelistega indica]